MQIITSTASISSVQNTPTTHNDLTLPLFGAIVENDNYQLAQLLEKGAGANVTLSLHDLGAIIIEKYGDKVDEDGRDLLDSEKNPFYGLMMMAYFCPKTKVPPLFMAIANENLEAIHLLLDHGANMYGTMQESYEIEEIKEMVEDFHLEEFRGSANEDGFYFDDKSNKILGPEQGILSLTGSTRGFELEVAEVFHQSGMLIEDMVVDDLGSPYELLQEALDTKNFELISFLNRHGYHIRKS